MLYSHFHDNLLDSSIFTPQHIQILALFSMLLHSNISTLKQQDPLSDAILTSSAAL